MIRRDYLIVGAGIGGISACEGIRQHDKKGTIMLVGSETARPYHRPLLFKNCLGKNPPAFDKLQVHDEKWFEKHHIDVRLDTFVTQFNLERKQAVLINGQAIEFRKACIATGTRARRPPLAGAHLGNVFYLRSFRDVLALREVAELERDIVIVGGSFIALETAAFLSQWPKTNVVLMHRGKYLWNRLLDEESGGMLSQVFTDHGVKLLLNETLNGFEGRTVLKNVQTKSGQRFPAGLAIVAFGCEPNLTLFANTPLSYPHGTPVNDYLETDEKGIYAAGDIAAYPDRIFGSARRVEHWACAREQGLVAGQNMTGKKRIKWEWMPHATSTLFDLQFDFIGDFSKPPTRIEVEGDRAKKKFLIRSYQFQTLMGIALCNQPKETIEAARKQLRDWPREIKRAE